MAFYLPDFMENLEPLPEEIKKGFATIEQLDMHVENSMAQTSKRVDILFSIADSMSSDELLTRFNAIMEEGEKSIEKSENKIQMANHMEGLLNKYLKRLDDDLDKMKTELEVNSSGITEIIEQGVFDSEQSDTTSQKNISNKRVNKYQLKKCSFGDKKKVSNNNRNSKRKSRTVPSHTVTSENITTVPKNDTNIVTPLMNLAIEHVMTDSTAIETAVSEAVITTQQQSTEEHKQVGLRTSLRAVKFNQPLTGQKHAELEKLPKEVLIHEELARVNELLNTDNDKKSKHTELLTTQNAGIPTEDDVDMNESVGSNETLYCICKNVSYGTMVACDNKACPSEWFHYECVGIKGPPKGKWFCPYCITKMKNRKSHK